MKSTKESTRLATKRSPYIASAVINTIGATLALGGFVPLVVSVGMAASKREIVPSLVLGISLFGGCALYRFVLAAVNAFICAGKAPNALVPVADAGTFFLPVGVFMPFVLSALDGPWRWILLGLLAAYAVGGFTLYLTIVGVFRRYSIALGYALFFVLGPLLEPFRAIMNPEATIWFAAAAPLYAGALAFRGNKKFPYGEALWHAFVVGGLTLQYFGIRTLIP